MRDPRGLLPKAPFVADDVLTPREAIERFAARVALTPLDFEEVSLDEAAGRVLAASVVAVADLPSRARSTMDGFAIATSAGLARRSIVGEVRMGAAPPCAITASQALRIPTGGVLPDGADAVVPIEDAIESDALLELAAVPPPGASITPPGSDLRAGDRALECGRRLGAPELGVLATARSAMKGSRWCDARGSSCSRRVTSSSHRHPRRASARCAIPTDIAVAAGLRAHRLRGGAWSDHPRRPAGHRYRASRRARRRRRRRDHRRLIGRRARSRPTNRGDPRRPRRRRARHPRETGKTDLARRRRRCADLRASRKSDVGADDPRSDRATALGDVDRGTDVADDDSRDGERADGRSRRLDVVCSRTIARRARGLVRGASDLAFVSCQPARASERICRRRYARTSWERGSSG